MATFLSVHAHPDDEAIGCGGTIAKAVAAGHRVVVVTATRGEHGEVADGFLRPGETLADRRVEETAEAVRILGAARHEFLGYVDSGMMGTADNDAPGSFWAADVEDAARRLARVLEEEGADVLSLYDAEGTYGHPDHIQVHRVGARAAELAGTPKVYEQVANRDRILSNFTALREAGIETPFDPDDMRLGVSEDRITTAVDVHDYLGIKRSAMAAHASQIDDTSFFLAMPPEMFAEAFGTEWFILRGATPARPLETDLFAGLGGS